MMRSVWLVLACAGIAAGCGGEGDSAGADAVPVSGVVTFDGKPLVGAEVVFSNGEFSSFGKTNSEGRYTLALGAVPGENKVSISKWEGEELNLDPEAGMDEGQIEAGMMAADPENPQSMANMPRQLIPEDYNTRSKLTYPVPEGGTGDASFNLQGN